MIATKLEWFKRAQGLSKSTLMAKRKSFSRCPVQERKTQQKRPIIQPATEAQVRQWKLFVTLEQARPLWPQWSTLSTTYSFTPRMGYTWKVSSTSIINMKTIRPCPFPRLANQRITYFWTRAWRSLGSRPRNWPERRMNRPSEIIHP